MDPNTIPWVLGIAIFVAVHLPDRTIKRKLEKKKASRKRTNTHVTR